MKMGITKWKRHVVDVGTVGSHVVMARSNVQ